MNSLFCVTFMAPLWLVAIINAGLEGFGISDDWDFK